MITGVLVAGFAATVLGSPAQADPGPQLTGGGCATPIKATRSTWGNQVGVRAGMTQANTCRWVMRARVHCQASVGTYYRTGAKVTRPGQISEAKCDSGHGYYGKQGYEVAESPYTSWRFVQI